LKDESNILYHEANALYWVKALLRMMYWFIDHAIEAAQEPPPFKIPHLCFVDTGAGQPVKSNGTMNVAYLIEELIPVSADDEFVKYIHNDDVAPCFLLDMNDEGIADFLAFTQHVQYVKMGRQVYILDYQGTHCSMVLCSINLH
ncbi:hypothetical protein EDC04DRAFT_2586134, partial [Pisolithus marmoratus]